MRKQNKVILWPVYFDSTKTRRQGRRVPKNLAVPTPRLEEIQKALERKGFRYEVFPETRHPSIPWQKTGLIMVAKTNSKMKIIREVAKELIKTVRDKSS